MQPNLHTCCGRCSYLVVGRRLEEIGLWTLLLLLAGRTNSPTVNCRCRAQSAVACTSSCRRLTTSLKRSMRTVASKGPHLWCSRKCVSESVHVVCDKQCQFQNLKHGIQVVLYCIDGMVIAAQCTATFTDLLCCPELMYY